MGLDVKQQIFHKAHTARNKDQEKIPRVKISAKGFRKFYHDMDYKFIERILQSTRFLGDFRKKLLTCPAGRFIADFTKMTLTLIK